MVAFGLLRATSTLALVATLVFLLPVLGGARAQELGEEWPDRLEDVRILVLAPRVSIFERRFGDLLDPREDWSAAGRKEVLNALQAFLADSRAAISWEREADGAPEQRAIVDGLLAMHSAVGAAMMTHFEGRDGLLPTKRADLFWTLGEGTRDLRRLYAADYGLFLEFNDSHSSVGRLLGKLIPPSVPPDFKNRQVSLASLVHLESGRVVWFRHKTSRFGDLREANGAEAAVTRVLADFPAL